VKKLLTLAVLAGFFFAGCNPFDSGETSYFPLSVGNTWRYVFVDLTVESGTTDTFSIDTVDIEVTALAELASGDSAFTVESDDDDLLEEGYYRVTDDFVLFFEDLDDDEPDTLLKMPLDDVSPWRQNEYVLAQVRGQEDTTVVAGTYKDCWKIRYSEDNDLLYDRWYAPNVGICLQQWFESDGGATDIERYELISTNVR